MSRRSNANPRFVFFGGKGGVGKTTCAAAWALHESRAGRQVLAVSTDPAHSLGDALETTLSGGRPKRISVGRRTLWAMELDGPRVYRQWLVDHRRGLREVIEHGTWLDREDIDALLDLSVPGVDELVGLLEINRVANESTTAFDVVVVDTAPTGHTLRLLAAPGTVAAVAEVLDTLQSEHRLIRERLARIRRADAADRLIALLARRAQEIAALLRDPDRASVSWIMLPEKLSLAESDDALRALSVLGVHVSRMIVNRVLADGPACRVCDARRNGEQRLIGQIARRLPRVRNVSIVRAEIGEPFGAASLTRIGKQLAVPASSADRPRSVAATASARGRLRFRQIQRMVSSVSAEASTISLDTLAEFRDARLLMFGGKGGVGKTTAAAAVAICLAQADPTRAVMLISTDPAHSLGDVLDTPLGDEPRTIPGGPKNLRVRELDAPAALAKRRQSLEAALDQIAAGVGADESSGPVSGGSSELMELAPPGIDELLGMLEVAQFVEGPAVNESRPDSAGRYDLVILDTAPTGHTLRLLEMPDAIREWVQLLMRVLLKYRQVVRPGLLASELLDLSKSIRALQEMMHDPSASRFVIVTRAAEVPRLETERLMARLRRLRLATPAMIVNAMTLAPGKCTWCRAVANAERSQLLALVHGAQRRTRRCAIILAPLAVPPPHGVVLLRQWAASLIRHQR